jgi:transposase
MLTVRTTKTGSGKVAVQVVDRFNHETKIVRHIGSTSDKTKLLDFLKIAKNLVFKLSSNYSLFPELFEEEKGQLVNINNLKIFPNHKHMFAYEFLSYFYQLLGFSDLELSILKHLVFARIIKPSSKIESLRFLKKNFGIRYGHSSLYSELLKINNKKDKIEEIAINYAQKHLSFDFTLVFFDVTTLYFETFKEDEDNFRKPGFSKDGKHQQPQILVGLVVTKEGYPISIETFEGNTFEGQTMLPVILNLKKKYSIENLTIVADAGMLSFHNMEVLQNNNLQYVVGARMSGIKEGVIKNISEKINRQENYIVEAQTKYGRLLVDYSKKRASKDKSDREKQIKKAEFQIIKGNPILKRIRFLKEKTKTKYELNQHLIDKDIVLDGLKGYYTNTNEIDTRLLINRYKDLWHVEKAFRIAKSDLLARPMFHHKKENVKAHILIVFVSLAIAKIIELETKLSIKKVVEQIWDILDITFEDTLTKFKFTKRTQTTENPLASYVDKYHKNLKTAY